MQIKIFVIYFILAFVVASCNDKICPAYQSFYIFDDDYRDDLFSPFTATDSVPEEPYYEAVKNKYGLASLNKFEPASKVLPFIRYNQKLRIVEMEYIMPGTWQELQQESQQVDSGEFDTELIGEIVTIEDDFEPEPEQEMEEEADSVAPPNEDQFYYEYVFGDYLQEWLDEQSPEVDTTAEGSEDAEAKEKGIKGFFQSVGDFFTGLFSKKDKEQLDATDEESSKPESSQSEEVASEEDAGNAVEKKKEKTKKKKKEKPPKEPKKKKEKVKKDKTDANAPEADEEEKLGF